LFSTTWWVRLCNPHIRGRLAPQNGSGTLSDAATASL
jgi:hypothetical protein